MGLELRGDGKTVPRILQRVGRAVVTAAVSGAPSYQPALGTNAATISSPAPAPSCARTPRHAPCFLSRSFPAAREHKLHRKCPVLVDLCWLARQSQKRASRVFAPVSLHRQVFSLRVFVDPNSPRP